MSLSKKHRFKVGDKVIAISNEYSGNMATVGEAAEVVDAKFIGSAAYYILSNGVYIYEHEVELEYVYNSPLYQALL